MDKMMVSGHSTSSSLQYSSTLVSLGRAVDTANVATQSAEWFLSDLALDEPDTYNHPCGMPAWARTHNKNLAAALPELKGVFVDVLRRETTGVHVGLDEWGDPLAPASIQQLFQPVLDSVFFYGGHDDTLFVDTHLPHDVAKPTNGERIILFDGEGDVVPTTISASVLEVWFRRILRGADGQAYPLYLTKRTYGWQAYGTER